MLDLFVSTAYAQGAGAPAGQGSSMLLMIGGMVAIWYFLVIRPQTQQQKAHAAMIAALKKGDSVVTRGGLHGRVSEVEPDVLTIEVAKGVRIRIDKDKVSRRPDATTDSK